MRHFVNLSTGSMYMMCRLVLVGASLPNLAQNGLVSPNPLSGDRKLIVTSRAIKHGLERASGGLQRLMGHSQFSIGTRMNHYVGRLQASCFMESSKAIQKFIIEACCPAAGENTANVRT